MFITIGLVFQWVLGGRPSPTLIYICIYPQNKHTHPPTHVYVTCTLSPPFWWLDICLLKLWLLGNSLQTHTQGELSEQKHKVLYDVMPVIWLKPGTHSDYSHKPRNNKNLHFLSFLHHDSFNVLYSQEARQQREGWLCVPSTAGQLINPCDTEANFCQAPCNSSTGCEFLMNCVH